MAELSAGLLESGQAASAPGCAGRSTVRAAAATLAGCAGVLAAAGIFLGGAEFGRANPHAGEAYGVSLKALNGSAPTALAAGLDVSCYTFTGGTCHISGCDPKRGSSCEDGLCMCVASACAGVDGACHHERNPEVAAGFTLTNVKYDWQKMYMPATDPFSHIKTTALGSFWNFGKDKWVLHRLPGTGAGPKQYFLTTERFPDYVATIQATLGTAVSPFAAFEVGLYKEKGPDELAVRVCVRDDGNLMIGWVGVMATQWFYLHHGSWEVFAWNLGDPGPGGYWTADPPIDAGVLDSCGTVF